MIICKECGAEFEEREPACPYCDALNYIGAEAQYMDNLEDIRSDLSEMSDDAKEAYTSSAKKSTIVIIVTLCCLLLVAAIVLSLILITHAIISATEDEDLVKAQMLWREQYMDDLDAMYEAGEYDEILAFIDEHAEDKGFSFYSWEHSDFIEVYNTYTRFQTDLLYFDINDKDMVKWTLYDAISLDYFLSGDVYMFTEEEIVLIEGWREESYAFYRNTLGLSDAEIEEMKAFVSADNDFGLPSSKMCEKYLEEYLGF